MRFLLITSILIFYFYKPVSAINDYQYAQLLDTLIYKQEYNSALDLVDRMIFFNNPDSNTSLIIKKAYLNLCTGSFSQVYPILYPLLKSADTSRSRSISLMLTGLSFVGMEDYYTALFFLEQSGIHNVHKTARNLICGYCYLMVNNTKEAKKFFEYSGIDDFNGKYIYPIKKLKFERTLLLISSIIIPGSGQLIKGEIVNGISGIALNAFLVHSIISIGTNSIAEGIIFALPLFLRYYYGTISRVDKVSKNNIKEYNYFIINSILKDLYK